MVLYWVWQDSASGPGDQRSYLGFIPPPSVLGGTSLKSLMDEVPVCEAVIRKENCTRISTPISGGKLGVTSWSPAGGRQPVV